MSSYFNGIRNSAKKALKKEYIDKGFCILRGAVEDEFLNCLEKEISFYFKNENQIQQASRRDYHFIKESKTISSLHNLYSTMPVYRAWIENSSVDKFIEYVFGEPLDPEWFQNSSYFAKPAKIGLETSPHQDNAFFNMQPSFNNSPPNLITCWFGLDDSSRSNGGLYYYESSSEIGDIKHYPIGSRGASMAIHPDDMGVLKKYKKEFIELKRNDMVLHNPWVVHGSHANTSPLPRRGFNFSRKSVSCSLNKKKYQRYTEHLKQYLECEYAGSK